jgi:hypothetical protein
MGMGGVVAVRVPMLGMSVLFVGPGGRRLYDS